MKCDHKDGLVVFDTVIVWDNLTTPYLKSRKGGEKKRWSNGSEGNNGQIWRRRSPRLSVSERQRGKSSCTSTSCATTSPTTTSKGNLQFDYQLVSTLPAASGHKHAHLHSCTNSSSLDHKLKLFPTLHRQLHEVDKAAHHDDNSINREEVVLQSHEDNQYRHRDESWLPEKCILELVLDTLQRRDNYEIFAEPVDPSEVEEYYEIIKEPMDFGTIRAKLHEAMYTNLQQFERDIFLIFDNAMYFNSSATIYFRQARVLEDLAKKVFHVLRNDPENFELEFGATKRRSSRKLYGELRDSNGSCQKLEKDLRSKSMSTNIGQKGWRRGRRACMSGLDRRSTYKPWMSSLYQTDSTISPINYGTKMHIHVNEEDIGYKDSLLLFVKDLGQTARRVAKRKLQCQGLWKGGHSSAATNCWDPHPTTTSRKDQNFVAQSLFQRELKQPSVSVSNITTTPSGDEGKWVETLGFSRFTDTSAPAIWGSRSSAVSDEGKLDHDNIDHVPAVTNGSSGTKGINRDIKMTRLVEKDSSRVNYQVHTRLTDKFGLNQQMQAQGVSISSHTITPKDEVASNGMNMQPPSPFTFNLPYLKCRLREMNNQTYQSMCSISTCSSFSKPKWVGISSGSNTITSSDNCHGWPVSFISNNMSSQWQIYQPK